MHVRSVLVLALVGCAGTRHLPATQAAVPALDGDYTFSAADWRAGGVSGQIRFDSAGTLSLTVSRSSGVVGGSELRSCVDEPQVIVDRTLSLSCGNLIMRLRLTDGEIEPRGEVWVEETVRKRLASPFDCRAWDHDGGTAACVSRGPWTEHVDQVSVSKGHIRLTRLAPERAEAFTRE